MYSMPPPLATCLRARVSRGRYFWLARRSPAPIYVRAARRQLDNNRAVLPPRKVCCTDLVGAGEWYQWTDLEVLDEHHAVRFFGLIPGKIT